jgi:hypothetical protein
MATRILRQWAVVEANLTSTIAALTNLDVTSFNTGVFASVSADGNKNGLFQYNASGTGIPDGINIIQPASLIGRWYRLTLPPSPVFTVGSSGNPFFGAVHFNNTALAGLTVNLLTSAQISAIDPTTNKGSIVFNTNTNKFEGSNGTIWATVDTGGDVTGPATSFANEIPIFADTTGKVLTQSGCGIDPVTLVINSRGITFTYDVGGYPGVRCMNATLAQISAFTPATYAGAVAYATDQDKLYYAATAGSWIPVGNVTGPASSTSTAIATYSGSTGRVLQNTGVTIGTAGAGTDVVSANGVNFSGTANPGVQLKNLTTVQINALSALTYAGAIAYSTTDSNIYYSNGSSWVTISSGSTPLFGYVTIGTGGQYATITAALAANKTKWIAVGNVTETADVQFFNSGEYSMICNPGVSVTFQNASIVYNNATCNLYWSGGKLNYSFTTAGNTAFIKYLGTGKGLYQFSDCGIQDFSTFSDCYFNETPVTGSTQILSNVQFYLANISGCGPIIGAGTTTGLEFVGAGSSCEKCLTVSGGVVSGVRFTGTFSTGNTVLLSDCVLSNGYVGHPVNTPSIKIQALGSCVVENLTAKSTAAINMVCAGVGVSVSNVISGTTGSLYVGTGSNSLVVSSCQFANATFTNAVAGVRNTFRDTYFFQTSTLTIDTDGASFNGCNFAGDVFITADHVSITGFQVGVPGGSVKTITVDTGVVAALLQNGITEAPVVNNGSTPYDCLGVREWA